MRDKLFAVVLKISGRSAAWLARLVRDQEVGGSNPLAPTTSFRIRDLLHTKNPESAWLETKHSCLMPVGRKRSLFFEFIALQRKVRFTDHPVVEKVGTGSGFWKKNQKARFKISAFCQDVILLLRSLRATIQGKIFHCHFVRAKGTSTRSAGHLDGFRVARDSIATG